MSLPRPSPIAVEQGEFSPEERTLLLQVAHDSIISALEGREIPLDSQCDSAKTQGPRKGRHAIMRKHT